MINFTSITKYYISSNPTDMRNGREGLACIVREVMGHNPKCYDEAFIFYSKELFCASLGSPASLVEELAENQVYVKVMVY